MLRRGNDIRECDSHACPLGTGEPKVLQSIQRCSNLLGGIPGSDIVNYGRQPALRDLLVDIRIILRECPVEQDTPVGRGKKHAAVCKTLFPGNIAFTLTRVPDLDFARLPVIGEDKI